ncbi:MAG: hypothetical protein ACWA5P_07810 [bacterium]
MVRNSVCLAIFCSLTFNLNLNAQRFKSQDYENVLNDLLETTSAFILEENRIEKKYYYETYPISEAEHLKLIEKYWVSVEKLIELDKDFVYFLIKNRKLQKGFTRKSWVKTVNPYRSDIYRHYTKKEEIRILIDFYLIGEKRKIQKPEYFEKITFKDLKEFLRKRKSLNKTELKKDYSEWLKKLEI